MSPRHPDPSWAELRQITGRVARDCRHPEHGRSAMALTRLIATVIDEADGGATVISFADLHALIAPLLIGETDG